MIADRQQYFRQNYLSQSVSAGPITRIKPPQTTWRQTCTPQYHTQSFNGEESFQIQQTDGGNLAANLGLSASRTTTEYGVSEYAISYRTGLGEAVQSFSQPLRPRALKHDRWTIGFLCCTAAPGDHMTPSVRSMYFGGDIFDIHLITRRYHRLCACAVRIGTLSWRIPLQMLGGEARCSNGAAIRHTLLQR